MSLTASEFFNYVSGQMLDQDQGQMHWLRRVIDGEAITFSTACDAMAGVLCRDDGDYCIYRLWMDIEERVEVEFTQLLKNDVIANRPLGFKWITEATSQKARAHLMKIKLCM